MLLEEDKRNKIVKPVRGLEGYKFKLNLSSDSTIATSEGNAVNINTLGESISEGNGNGETTQETQQHFGGIATLSSAGSQVVTFASLGFPSVIQLASAPRLILWADRAVILEDYDNSSLTIEPSAVGVANTPFNVGVEVAGYADAIPNYIYDPFIVGRNLREDKSFYPYFWDEEKVIIKGIPGGIAGYPITCGLFISGKLNESDTRYRTWYVEVELDSDSEEFLYEDMNIGNVDSEIHRVFIDLDDWQETHYFGTLGITPNIANARISGLTPLRAREGFISACTDTSVTLNASKWGEANFPLRYALEIRGG